MFPKRLLIKNELKNGNFQVLINVISFIFLKLYYGNYYNIYYNIL